MPKPNSSSPSTLEIREVDTRQLHYLAPFTVESVIKITAKTKDGREYKRDALTLYSKIANTRFRWVPSFRDDDRELWAQITTYLLINPDYKHFTFEKKSDNLYILVKALA